MALPYFFFQNIDRGGFLPLLIGGFLIWRCFVFHLGAAYLFEHFEHERALPVVFSVPGSCDGNRLEWQRPVVDFGLQRPPNAPALLDAGRRCRQRSLAVPRRPPPHRLDDTFDLCAGRWVPIGARGARAQYLPGLLCLSARSSAPDRVRSIRTGERATAPAPLLHKCMFGVHSHCALDRLT